MLNVMINDKWIDNFLSKTKLSEHSDPLLLINLFELEKEFLEKIIEFNEESIQVKTWNYFQDYLLDIMESLRCDAEKIPLLSLFLPLIFQIFGLYLKLNVKLNLSGALSIGEYSDFDSQLLSILEQFYVYPEDCVKESIISCIGNFGAAEETQSLLYTCSNLCDFYKNSLTGPKSMYLSFINSFTELLHL